MAAPAQAAAPASAAAPDWAPETNHSIIRQNVINNFQQLSQQDAIRQRDIAGREMARLAQIMNDPKINRKEITDYIDELAGEGDLTVQEATGILANMPPGNDQKTLRAWAQAMLAVALHTGVHAEAAYPRELFPGNPQHQGITPAEPEGAAEEAGTPKLGPSDPSQAGQPEGNE